MGTYGEAYRDARMRVGELARALKPDELEVKVPACPEWTRKDLVAHVAGIAADFAAGNVGGAGQDDWTAAQIEARRDKTLEEILAEWATDAEQVEPALDAIPPVAAALTIADLVVHEHDLRGSLGNTEARAGDGVMMALPAYVRLFGKRLKDAALPTVLVKAAGDHWQAGLETPRVELEDDAFELFRALAGRRTKDEVRKLGWSGDPEPYVDLFSSYGYPAESLAE